MRLVGASLELQSDRALLGAEQLLTLSLPKTGLLLARLDRQQHQFRDPCQPTSKTGPALSFRCRLTTLPSIPQKLRLFSESFDHCREEVFLLVQHRRLDGANPSTDAPTNGSINPCDDNPWTLRE
jgi:hypothetical protein